MRITTFILVFLLFVHFAFAQKTPIKVLFIGNSLTFVNDLPGTLKKVAHSAGDSIYTDQSAIPGYTLAQHLQDTSTLNKIKRQKWDYVVIQEQSEIPSFPPAQVDTQFIPYAHKLDSLVHRNDSCTHTVFFLTPGHKYGDPLNCGSYSILCTYDGVQSRLRQSYLLAADTNKAMVAPVGIAWYHSWHSDSSINLWQSDRTHPTVAGAYLSACTFYSTLFQKDCSKVTYVTSGITAKQALFLRNIAGHTVLDSLSTWYIGTFNPHTSFTFKTSGLSVVFSNTSKYATHYKWLFGDGSTGYSISPTHTYTSKTVYTASLVSYHDCMSDTLKKIINTTGIEELTALNHILIYPNPSKDLTNFDFSGVNGQAHVRITNLTGVTVFDVYTSDKVFVWKHSTLSTGLYLITIALPGYADIHRQLVIH